MSDGMEIDVNGTDLLVSIFKTLSGRMKTDMVNVAARGGANYLKKEVKKNIQSMGLKRTGNLFKNVVSRKVRRTNGTYIVAITSDAFYGSFIEYGIDTPRVSQKNGKSTGILPPKPFFRRAIDDRRGIQGAIFKTLSKRMIRDMKIISGSYGSLTKTQKKKLTR